MLFRSIYASVSDNIYQEIILMVSNVFFFDYIVVIDIWIARVELWRKTHSK
jgi:hypothetical protein